MDTQMEYFIIFIWSSIRENPFILNSFVIRTLLIIVINKNHVQISHEE